jgi:hypothetical protein
MQPPVSSSVASSSNSSVLDFAGGRSSATSCSLSLGALLESSFSVLLLILDALERLLVLLSSGGFSILDAPFCCRGKKNHLRQFEELLLLKILTIGLVAEFGPPNRFVPSSG